jgi:hypothetical protein
MSDLEKLEADKGECDDITFIDALYARIAALEARHLDAFTRGYEKGKSVSEAEVERLRIANGNLRSELEDARREGTG